MSLEKQHLVALLKEVRDSSRYTLVTSLHDLFSYVRAGAQGSDALSRYEADRVGKWSNWGEGRTYTAWEMPLDIGERKSLAYHLYCWVLEANSPGADITHFMYAGGFDENVACLHRDFFKWLLGAVEDIFESSCHAGAGLSAKGGTVNASDGAEMKAMSNQKPRIFVGSSVEGLPVGNRPDSDVMAAAGWSVRLARDGKHRAT